MSPVLTEILASGVSLAVVDDKNLRALGPLTDETRAQIRQHKPALLYELLHVPHYRWLVQSATRVLEVRFNPEATLQEVADRYPDAHIAPMLESANTQEAHHE